jgi:hypothetical protein
MELRKEEREKEEELDNKLECKWASKEYSLTKTVKSNLVGRWQEKE